MIVIFVGKQEIVLSVEMVFVQNVVVRGILIQVSKIIVHYVRVIIYVHRVMVHNAVVLVVGGEKFGRKINLTKLKEMRICII